MKRIVLLIFPLVASVAVAQSNRPATSEDHADVRVEMKTAKGQNAGAATITETPHGLLIRYTPFNLPTGMHAIHLHETGRCDAPTFESAGGHFNPSKAGHGFASAKGYHAGDMPNIHVSAGRETHEVFVSGVKLRTGNMLLDADGAALVVHAGVDDHASDPAGNSGDRIACGTMK
jgi:superoxide dismutase, Cu-Zn family